MSTRCQIEFRCGDVRRTVYRHSDGYPSAVIEDLLAFLAWSVRGSDVEYVAANFLYWSKRELGASEQLGLGVCMNDELHGDIAYYYVVRYAAGGCTISAHEVEREDGRVGVGRVVAVGPAPSSFSADIARNLGQNGRFGHAPQARSSQGGLHARTRAGCGGQVYRCSGDRANWVTQIASVA
jgi:hypothetical protein